MRGYAGVTVFLGDRVLLVHEPWYVARDGRVDGYSALVSASVQLREVVGRVGKNLLRDAILRSVQASEIIGVRALLVHALHDTARAFYAHFDVEPSPTDPLHQLLLMKDARSAVGPGRGGDGREGAG